MTWTGSYGPGLQFGLSAVGLLFPRFIDFGIRIEACDEAFEEMRAVGWPELQCFSFQSFKVGHFGLQETFLSSKLSSPID